jgi:hypothetical protein
MGRPCLWQRCVEHVACVVLCCAVLCVRSSHPPPRLPPQLRAIVRVPLFVCVVHVDVRTGIVTLWAVLSSGARVVRRAVQQEYTRAMPKRLIIAVSRNGILLMKIPDNFTEGTMVRATGVFGAPVPHSFWCAPTLSWHLSFVAPVSGRGGRYPP